MKTLADGYEVPSRIYYYLLDWNQQDNWRYITDNFGKELLKDLVREEFLELFEYATKVDLSRMV